MHAVGKLYADPMFIGACFKRKVLFSLLVLQMTMHRLMKPHKQHKTIDNDACKSQQNDTALPRLHTLFEIGLVYKAYPSMIMHSCQG